MNNDQSSPCEYLPQESEIEETGIVRLQYIMKFGDKKEALTILMSPWDLIRFSCEKGLTRPTKIVLEFDGGDINIKPFGGDFKP